ncbi:MAG TPA: peptide deformylase, partial [Candidatus Methylomirabilis sp.]|nr:peptide deformylase [Candidatus Methylomirabilis sp.]
GFHARVLQHERDHLLGKLFIDRMPNFETLSYLPEFARYWSR